VRVVIKYLKFFKKYSTLADEPKISIPKSLMFNLLNFSIGVFLVEKNEKIDTV